MTASVSAWPSGTDPAVLRREVARAHEEFLTTGRSPTQLRELVRDSWLRCVSSGVNPDGIPRLPEFTGSDLRDFRREHLLHAVMPVIRRLLVEFAQDNVQLVAVGDESARLLWVEGDPSLVSRAEHVSFVEGSQWAEHLAGTNGPGTALALSQPLQIYTTEHFRRPSQGFSCSAAPIHDPDTGAVLGVVNLSGGDHDTSPQPLTLVRAAVAAAESELRLLRMNRVLPRPGTQRHRPDPLSGPRYAAGQRLLEVLGRDRGRLTTPRGRTELSPRHSEILYLLATHSRGLTADELGVQLRREDSARVTVRAETSLLRQLLGGDLLASQPYRLLEPVTTDADEVRSLLRRGAHRQALAVYAGPLLPHSEAPAVAEDRDALASEVRSSLLQHADAQLLTEWLDRPENTNDADILRGTTLSLPPSSPRHPTHRSRERPAWTAAVSSSGDSHDPA
jgi:hypothetical protein